MFWLLTLPIRLVFALVFGILFLPFLILRVFFKLAVGLVLAPIVLLVVCAGLVVAGLAFFFAVLVPLLPLALLAIGVWVLIRLLARPAVSL